MRPVVFALTIALSAALLFVIEPVAAKALLPRLGGSAGVWIACVLFFQFALLAGYLYAYALTRYCSRAAQRGIHAALAVASVFALPWHPPEGQPGGNPALGILGILAGSIGMPFFLLSTTSPLLQSWYAQLPGASFPYRLFALSNAASLAALLAYPVAIEPALALPEQFRWWCGAYVAFALILVGQTVALRGRPGYGAVPQTTEIDGPRHMGGLPYLWIALPAVAAVLWPAVANHLSQEVAPVPFLWVLPLSLYLLSFILCFESSGWYRPELFRWLLPAACAVFGWRLAGQGSMGGIAWEIPLFCAALFVCCMFCHGELARLKPDPKHGLAFFYVMVALGGALGAAFVGIAAPALFHTYLELPIGIAACVVLSLPLLYRRGSPRQLLRLALVATLAFIFAARYSGSRDTVARTRNFYGALQISDSGSGEDAYRALYNGKILHGIEYLAPGRNSGAVTYYSRYSGIGRAFESLRMANRHVGIAGLGAGSLAAYGRPGDSFRFYDINPAVIDAATRYFQFLSESQARVETIAMDGRLGLEREPPHSFDMIVLDAFSGDSIPVHLLTREAFQMYFERLKPGGILAVHVTNRYLDVASVVRAVAANLRKPNLLIHNGPGPDPQNYAADWALLSGRAESLAALSRFAAPQAATRPASLWTDNYSNLFGILK